MELTSDCKNLVVNPQHLLYYVPSEEDQRDGEGQNDDGDTDEDENEGEDEGENGDDANSNHALANTTMESLDSTTSTKPERSAEEIIPDFAIIRIIYGVQNTELKKTWVNVKIRHAGVPLLAENKCSGKRSLPKAPFLKSTTTFISTAQRDLFRKVHIYSPCIRANDLLYWLHAVASIGLA